MVRTLAVWVVIFAGIMVLDSAAVAGTGNADAGKKIFLAKCETCHGQDGSADTPVGKSLKAADLRSPDVQKKPDSDFYAQVEKGKGKMPGFAAALNKTQIDDVIAYVRQIGKSAAKK
jgi:mono/diheme cytochrome c family protein